MEYYILDGLNFLYNPTFRQLRKVCCLFLFFLCKLKLKSVGLSGHLTEVRLRVQMAV